MYGSTIWRIKAWFVAFAYCFFGVDVFAIRFLPSCSLSTNSKSKTYPLAWVIASLNHWCRTSIADDVSTTHMTWTQHKQQHYKFARPQSSKKKFFVKNYTTHSIHWRNASAFTQFLHVFCTRDVISASDQTRTPKKNTCKYSDPYVFLHVQTQVFWNSAR